MSYFDDASLVMIPSGTKTSKVYSVKPIDGTGDLTFTRSNDTATRVASNGLIEKVRTNVLLQSNSFDTTWVNTNTTETGGQAGYDGTNNAWLLEKSASEGRIYQDISLSGINTFSVYVKAGTKTWCALYVVGPNAGKYFNLSTGSIGSNVVGAPLDAKIESVGNGWYRVSVAVSGSITQVRIYPADADLDISGTSGNILIQAAQLEAGDIATEPILTTSAAVSVGPVANVPRLDYLGSSCPRLLLEPQRTNSLTYSEQLNNAAWTSLDNVSVSANVSTTLDPSGYYGADKLVENTANTQHRIYRVFTGTGSTFSFFAKAAERSWVSVLSNDGNFSFFNIANGTLGTIAATSTATITPYGNGWYRCTLYNTHGNFGALIQLTTANNVTSYLGDGTSGAFIWGCQFESSVTYATSYIPTLAAAVTRGTEQYDKVITSLVPDATTFTWEVDFIVPEVAGGGGEIFGRNAAGTIQLRIYANNGGVIRFRVESGAQNYDTAVSVGDTAKCIFRCSSGVVSAFYNGVKIHTFTGVSMDFGKIQFGPPVTSPKIIRSLVFPTALTDAQCIELTA
jgi:hypothetical protein